MLLFFLLCSFLHTLWGKPLPSPLGLSLEVAANATTTTSYEQCPAVPDDGGQQLRSVYDIVQSCFFTIAACVWKAIHPNINGPRDSWWTCMKRRLNTTFYTMMAPEMVLFCALNQRFSAKEIMDQYNKDFKTLEEPKTSLWAEFKQLFQRLPEYTSRRGASVRQPWTITHGFFIQMGGFILYDNEFPTEALTYKRLAKLLREEAIDMPSVTERELQDRSKGDTISKGIAVLQTTWFALQCIVRGVQHLPLSELEVLTLAFTVMNGAIYMAWWSKPQGVDTAICVPLKRLENSAADLDPNPSSSSQADYQQPDDSQRLIQPDEEADEKHSWVRRMLHEDRKDYNPPTFLLVRIPYRLFTWIFHSIDKMGGCYEPQQKLRMPMFYSGHKHDTTLPGYIAYTIGVIFGALHLIGWSFEFPLPRDRILWRVSAIILAATPLMVIIQTFLGQRVPVVLETILGTLVVFLVPCYIASRFIVTVIAFQTIMHPSHNILLDISWTRHIPHF